MVIFPGHEQGFLGVLFMKLLTAKPAHAEPPCSPAGAKGPGTGFSWMVEKVSHPWSKKAGEEQQGPDTRLAVR